MTNLMYSQSRCCSDNLKSPTIRTNCDSPAKKDDNNFSFDVLQKPEYEFQMDASI